MIHLFALVICPLSSTHACYISLKEQIFFIFSHHCALLKHIVVTLQAGLKCRHNISSIKSTLEKNNIHFTALLNWICTWGNICLHNHNISLSKANTRFNNCVFSKVSSC